jgi:hypothetical protein
MEEITFRYEDLLNKELVDKIVSNNKLIGDKIDFSVLNDFIDKYGELQIKEINELRGSVCDNLDILLDIVIKSTYDCNFRIINHVDRLSITYIGKDKMKIKEHKDTYYRYVHTDVMGEVIRICDVYDMECNRLKSKRFILNAIGEIKKSVLIATCCDGEIDQTFRYNNTFIASSSQLFSMFDTHEILSEPEITYNDNAIREFNIDRSNIKFMNITVNNYNGIFHNSFIE